MPIAVVAPLLVGLGFPPIVAVLFRRSGIPGRSLSVRWVHLYLWKVFLKNTLDEIFQFRELLEPQIAALAAQNATQAGHKVLQDILERQQNEIKNDVSKGLDQDFHLALVRVTGNAVLVQIIQLLAHIFLKSRHEYSQSTHRKRLSIQGHQKIVTAIQEAQPKAARDLMAAHLSTIRELVLSPNYNQKK